MQLKGLVRFFTIVLILVSLYVLSFTWFVRSHEKKMEARAESFMKVNYPAAAVKYPGNKDSQAIYQLQLDTIKAARLKRLLDSTKDEVITYGITGPVSYQKAKSEELNLGLDLQGGMNVTLEVEMTGLLKTLSNNSKDPVFLRAIDNANKRKANSDANFINLFTEEYEKLNPNGKLSSLFAAASGNLINLNSSNGEVKTYLNTQSRAAFDNTFRVLNTRIDQFGVAQPNINPDRDRGIITVDLPGIQDKERVRKYLQSSANLQFWEVYNISEIWPQIMKADDAFFTMMGGKAAAKPDTTKKATDTIAVAKQPGDTSGGATGKISDITPTTTDTTKKADSLTAANNDAQKRLGNYISFSIDPQAQKYIDNGTIGYVQVRDTGDVRTYLQSDAVRKNFPSDLTWMYGIQEKKSAYVTLYAIKTNGKEKAKLEGDVITNAAQDYDQSGKPNVSMTMNGTGARIWGEMTRLAAGRPNDPTDNKHIAISLDNIVYSAPVVNEAIEGGTSSISGGFTVEEAQDLANILKSGKLSAPAKIVQEQQVGPTLGAEAIKGGIMAFGISFIVIFLLMLIYYNSSGWVANIALILNLLFTIGVLTALGATLTAPGIAGLVLTIGMAVDTNVIIYERIKEELDKGKGYIPAINEGYKRSLPPVLDAHITTLLTAIILFYFGLGPVKGFATTQILGILLSLFCGILVSRWVSDIFTNKKKHLEYFTGISRRIFKHAKFKFIEYRKVAYGISVVVLLAGIGSFFHGFDEGVEFKGGRSYTVAFNGAAKVEEIRDGLEKTFNEAPVIKTVGNSSTLDITTSYLIDSTGDNVDNAIEAKLLDGLKPYNAKGIIGFKKVLPTISDDLKAGAIKATIFAILVIFLYIFIRFRDWRYSFGTIVALLHDVLVTLAVFSFAKDIGLPFPLEIDQHFIAAILTVIGFSMNDTVIVFDRIREDRKLYPSAPLGETINRAINETLSRTIMTSLTVFLTLLILFLVGGEVTKGFAFAMLIGVITGTYSSIFVAAPILVDLTTKKNKAAVTTKPDVKSKTTV
ncbi:MAG: protein translocase subunit SecDF [Chitinophagaceae bacterium]